MRALQLSFALLLLSAITITKGAPTDFRPASEFHHTAWTIEQGAPADLYAMAQAPDGWLWFGGPPGLFRFDGVQFEQVAIADGVLWAGTARASRWQAPTFGSAQTPAGISRNLTLDSLQESDSRERRNECTCRQSRNCHRCELWDRPGNRVAVCA